MTDVETLKCFGLAKPARAKGYVGNVGNEKADESVCIHVGDRCLKTCEGHSFPEGR